jgi:hypothetical protein
VGLGLELVHVQPFDTGHRLKAMVGVLWTVWKLEGGRQSVARWGRGHNDGAKALWECFLDQGLDQSGAATGSELRLVIEEPLAVQTSVAPDG